MPKTAALDHRDDLAAEVKAAIAELDPTDPERAQKLQVADCMLAEIDFFQNHNGHLRKFPFLMVAMHCPCGWQGQRHFINGLAAYNDFLEHRDEILAALQLKRTSLHELGSGGALAA